MPLRLPQHEVDRIFRLLSKERKQTKVFEVCQYDLCFETGVYHEDFCPNLLSPVRDSRCRCSWTYCSCTFGKRLRESESRPITGTLG